ncbi:MAG: FAD:protein FMN transferase [Acidimicrobiia bacterium]
MTTTLTPASGTTPSPTVGADPWVHLVWRALGTEVLVTVLAASVSDADLIADLAPPILERLEARWSRFRPDSELSRLNRAAGTPVMVSDETFDAVARAVEAWRATHGGFDPTVLPSLLALGYDRDFRSVAADGAAVNAPGPTTGCAGIALDPLVHAVTLPTGTTLDLGGIGKGLSADRLASELLKAGAIGVCADLGGDVRVSGTGPRAGAWPVTVDDPLATGATGSLSIRDGAVATSTHLRRSWRRGGRTVHHLVDPRTGEPAAAGLASVTVVAGTTWWAEVLAKAAYIAGPDAGADLIAEAGVTGLFVHDDGQVTELPGLEAFRP